MTDLVNEFFAARTRHKGFCFDEMHCVDGFHMSVQASRTHYCQPRETIPSGYYSVEVGFPSSQEPLLMGYAETPEKPTDTVYGYVPVEVVEAVINKHGGLKPCAQ